MFVLFNVVLMFHCFHISYLVFLLFLAVNKALNKFKVMDPETAAQSTKAKADSRAAVAALEGSAKKASKEALSDKEKKVLEMEALIESITDSGRYVLDRQLITLNSCFSVM